MKFRVQFLGLVLLSGLLTSCSSDPAEEYVDYFYSKLGDNGEKVFTYILYLGDKGKSLSQHQKEHASISHREKNDRAQTTQRRSSKVKKGEEFTSLSFRMEEEAYKRLIILLDKKNYCTGEVEYLESEYSWLRYSIKGRCKT